MHRGLWRQEWGAMGGACPKGVGVHGREGHRGLRPRGRGLRVGSWGRGLWRGGRGRCCRGLSPQGTRPPGLRTTVCHLGFCVAPPLRSPAGLGLEAPQLCGPAAERPRRFGARRPPGLRTRVCHLGFCAAPQLRGPAGLGFAAPQLRGPAAERPRRFRAHGGRDCVQGMPFRVLRGPAAAQPRRLAAIGVCGPGIGAYRLT